MRRLTRTLTIVALATVVGGCERFFLQPEPAATPQAIFDEAWTFADREYSFFGFKGIDWDATREAYEARITDDMTDEELFDVIADMLSELRDGHVNLVSDFDRSRNWEWYLDYEENFDYKTLERDYFAGDEQFVGDAFILYDFSDYTSAPANVIYIYYPSFSNPINDADLDYVMARLAAIDADGLIIDVRNNGGGSVGNAFALAERFATQTRHVLNEQRKRGPGHDDFGAGDAITLPAYAGSATFAGEVVVLTNRKSYSATNYFAAMMKGLDPDPETDRITLIGDTTGGGGGLPAYTELANGWTIRVSSSRLFARGEDGAFTDNVEDGIAPDVAVTALRTELAAGTDAILEAALAHIADAATP